MSKKYPGGVLSRTAPVPSGAFQNSTASGLWNMEDVAKFRQQGNWPIPGNVQTYIEDVFSTTLYTGTGGTQTITNNINLAGSGGMVWLKNRASSPSNHYLMDSARSSFGARLSSNSTNAQTVESIISSVSSTGFTLGPGDTGSNGSGTSYVSWTFRRQPKFFDVVTYTGTGSARTVSHNLGSVPGCIVVKSMGSPNQGGADGFWFVYHRGLSTPQSGAVFFNNTDGRNGASTWQNTLPTSTEFTVVSGDNNTNISGRQYVAYLFAHDAGGFGDSGNDNVITCGSYTGNGSSGIDINLGWEPQWIIIKRSDATAGPWMMMDNMRGLGTAYDNALNTNTGNAEAADVSVSGAFQPTATGFRMANGNSAINASGATYIYIAIRRPMRTPTVGTSVFTPVFIANANLNASPPTKFTTGFSPDFTFMMPTDDVTKWANTKLTAGYQWPSTTEAEGNGVNMFKWDMNDGVTATGFAGGLHSTVMHAFRRASGFFDVVCWTGDGSTGRLISHNLNSPPEIILMKSRSAVGDWRFWCRSNSFYAGTASSAVCLLPLIADGFNGSAFTYGEAAYFPAGLPTATQFSLVNGNAATNATGVTHVAYLFASCPGVSKVGNYTGNGSSQTINCGFTGGARFVLIKRTDSSGAWYVWDTARGIVTGNDPHLSLNSTAPEVTTNDSIDPDNTGFVVNQLAATNINVTSATYIFLAIA